MKWCIRLVPLLALVAAALTVRSREGWRAWQALPALPGGGEVRLLAVGMAPSTRTSRSSGIRDPSPRHGSDGEHAEPLVAPRFRSASKAPALGSGSQAILTSGSVRI